VEGILSGMSVVEGSAFVAAPLGGMTLAQMGADVIRFDPIGGGLDYRRWPVTDTGQSLFWAGMNKGKRSIQIDIRKPEGQALIEQLVSKPGENAGMFLTNFPERGWLAYDNLSRHRADLIYVNVMGDRHGGSAVDYTVNCAVGFTDVTGDPNSSDPTNYLLPAWDNITGQMAAVAMLAAERHRRMSGEGQLVKLALKDVALATAGHLGNISEVMVNNVDRQKYGNYIYGGFGKDFLTNDGKRFMLVGLTDRQWRSIVEVSGISDQVSNLEKKFGVDLSLEGERFKLRDALEKLISPWFVKHDANHVISEMDKHKVCYGPYQTFREMIDNDKDCSLDNPLFGMLNQPGIGEYLVPSSPIKFTKSDNLAPLLAPTLGQHTDEILADVLGLQSHEIAKLFDSKIVA
jgi:2-methylfumaryl-CoA isomerase